MANRNGVLSVGTWLNNRYIIIEEDRFQHCLFRTEYIAFDRISGNRVRIAEYFWHENAVRQSDDSVRPMNEDSFRRGMNWFCKHIYYARNMPEGFPMLLEHFEANGTHYAVLEWRDSEWCLSEWMTEAPMEWHEMTSIEPVLELLSGALEELSRLHSAGYIFRWLDDETIHMDIETKRTYLACFGNIGLYPDANDDPIEDWSSEPRRGWMRYCQPPESCMRKKEMGPYSAVYTLCAIMYVVVTGEMIPPVENRMFEPWKMPEGRFPPAVHRVLEKGLALRSSDRYQSLEELRWALQCAIRKSRRERTVYSV